MVLFYDAENLENKYLILSCGNGLIQVAERCYVLPIAILVTLIRTIARDQPKLVFKFSGKLFLVNEMKALKKRIPQHRFLEFWLTAFRSRLSGLALYH